MFENKISNEICNSFSITFKVISFGDNRKFLDFCIGHTTGETLEDSIMDWNKCLGEGINAATSSSWAFWRNALLCNGIYIKLPGFMDYSRGDFFKISFDFREKQVKIYHNNKECDCKDLTVTKLWVGLSLRFVGTHIEMIEYKYD